MSRYLVIPGDTIEIVQRKSKDAEAAPNLFAELQSVPISGWYDEDGEQVTSAVMIEGVEPIKPPKTIRSLNIRGHLRWLGRTLATLSMSMEIHSYLAMILSDIMSIKWASASHLPSNMSVRAVKGELLANCLHQATSVQMETGGLYCLRPGKPRYYLVLAHKRYKRYRAVQNGLYRFRAKASRRYGTVHTPLGVYRLYLHDAGGVL